jgi:hypothetical protein
MTIRWIVSQELYDNVFDLFPADIGINFRAFVDCLHTLEISAYQTVTHALSKLVLSNAVVQELVAVIERPRVRWRDKCQEPEYKSGVFHFCCFSIKA